MGLTDYTCDSRGREASGCDDPHKRCTLCPSREHGWDEFRAEDGTRAELQWNADARTWAVSLKVQRDGPLMVVFFREQHHARSFGELFALASEVL